MKRTKRKTESHLIDEGAQTILRKRLPNYWTIRDYKPDYGIDLSIELFQQSVPGSYDTLGEHLFVQLKGAKKLTTRKLTLPPRLNVEKYRVELNIKDNHDEGFDIEAISLPLESSELVTVQRMGSSIPVLLVTVDITTGRVFFLCLNDYIDKVLLPQDPHYACRGKKTVYIPIRNEITLDEQSILPLLLYAKRAKLYAAFQKFRYQHNELSYVPTQKLDEQAKHFAEILLRYDFWNSCPWWFPIAAAHQHLQNFLDTGRPGLMQYDYSQLPEGLRNQFWTDPSDGTGEYLLEEIQRFQEIRMLWDQLVNLGSIHEEICREWFLPTNFGVQATSGFHEWRRHS